MIYPKFVFLFLLFFSSFLSKGQIDNYNIRYFFTKEGLSHKNLFSAAGDEVIIEATQKFGQIQIRIKDTDVGITSSKLKNIFELDSKKPNREQLEKKGTGLGLLLCKKLLALNQGKIKIESAEGKGISVHVEFPLVA